MIKAKNVFIGFGKAAKTLAFQMAKKGESVVVIEQSDQMYGGTCINIACIPSKFLYELSSKPKLGSLKDNFHNAMMKKRGLIGKLRYSNFHKLSDLNDVKVLNGKASFIDKNTLKVNYKNGTSDTVEGERIFINTGATAFVPDIPGLKDSPRMVTSTEMLDLDNLPKELVIIGGGFIGMEFATTFTNFGSHVTIIEKMPKFMGKSDPEVREAVLDNFNEQGIDILENADVTKVVDQGTHSDVHVVIDGKEKVLPANTILVSIGRRPNVGGLDLEKAGVDYSPRGVKVDDHLKTNVDNIWAMGDVRGGAQFTFISLDDYRIVYNSIYGDAHKSLQEQDVVPHTVFLTPVLSEIGMTEEQAQAEHIHYRKAKVSTMGMPKAHILGHPKGFFKALVGDDDRILGATIYAPDAQEVINIISLAMHANLPYQMLRDQIYAHPSMSEGLNSLFGAIEDLK